MHPALVPMLSQSRQAGFTLAAAGLLNAPAVLSRTQTASTATALGLDGATWQSFGANAPRFAGTPRRLLIEGQRTNTCTHPVGIGAAPWTTLTAGGQTLSVTGGLPGSPANTSDATRLTGTGDTTRWGAWVTTAGAVHTVSAFVRRAPAAVTNQAFRLLGNAPLAFSPDFTATASWQRFSWQYTPTGTTANIGFTRPVSNAPYDIEVWGFQVEVGAFASTLILPPVGTPGASTRGGDIVTAPLASLGIGPNGAGTVLWTATHSAATAVNLWETFIELNDGSTANRFGVWRAITSNNARGYRSLAGVQAATTDIAITPAAVTRYGASIDGAGRLALSVNGAAPVVVTGGPASGLTTLRLGSEHSGGAPLFGEIGVARVIPGAMSDAALQALVATLA